MPLCFTHQCCLKFGYDEDNLSSYDVSLIKNIHKTNDGMWDRESNYHVEPLPFGHISTLQI